MYELDLDIRITYPEAEQALSKADNLVKDYAMLPDVREKDVEKWEIKLYMATAK